jgi:pimeloyl-ACP methyl ester carboxylesterase
MHPHVCRFLLPSVLLLGAVICIDVSAAEPTGVDPERIPYTYPATLAKLPDGRVIHVTCMGSGSPTVILTAGMGDWSVAWRKVQPAVARLTRACAWDRAGFGYSGNSPKTQLTANTTTDLEGALLSAEVAGPYVMVGHSLGGLESVMFADRHPEEVAGMVLVDPSSPGQAARFHHANPQIDDLFAAYTKKAVAGMRRCEIGVTNGTIRPGSPDPDACLVYPNSYPPETAAAMTKLDRDPARWATKASLLENFDANSMSLVNPARRFGAMPLVVLTAGEQWTAPPDLPPQSAAMFRDGISGYFAVANQLHEELAALSTRGSNRQVADSGHYIQYKRPDLVIAAIEDVVRQTRAGAGAGK